MFNIALIPARGGSKGVHKKNLRKINGISLVSRAIKSAKIKNVSKIIVSTDNITIKNESIKHGAEVPFFRSPILSNDDAIAEDLIRESILQIENYYGKKINFLIYLEPTSPFRNKKHVQQAFNKIQKERFCSVVSVCQLERKPENIFIKSNELTQYIIEPKAKFNKRQDMQNLCRLNSAIYIIKRDNFMKYNTLILNPVGWIEMTADESINIDTISDLRFARLISKNIENTL